MRIAIDVNGVLRDTIGKFTQLYQKHMIDDHQDEFTNETYTLNPSGDTELDVITPFKYEILSEVTSLNLRDHFTFQSDEELYDFIYNEFPMQIFGHAGSTEISSMNDLNDFYLNFRDDHDVLIVSDEIGKSKPATLFFLSKLHSIFQPSAARPDASFCQPAVAGRRDRPAVAHRDPTHPCIARLQGLHGV
jgi:hypothetical protein